MSTALFKTITSADWKRELARARATPNAIGQQIHASAVRGTRRRFLNVLLARKERP